jgi:hypothetical protein
MPIYMGKGLAITREINAMGKRTPSAPPPPDPVATSQAQSAANRETAIAQQQLNLIDQHTPQGSLTYAQRGTGPDGTPLYSATTSLSPQEQGIYNLERDVAARTGGVAQDLLGNARGALSKPVDLSSLGAIPQYDESARTQALARILARANPELDRQREAIESRLATQGITLGSEAYNSGVDEFNRARNDFTLGADVSAGNEAAQLFGLQMAGRQQGIQERLLPRNTTINELAALTGGSQVQMPQFASTPQTGIGQTDVAGPQALAYQGQLANWNAGQQRNNAAMGGLFGLGAAGLSAFGPRLFA